jgi:hypothetical protein
MASARHEGVYLWAPRDMHDLERLLEKWFADYKRLERHEALGGLTPWEVPPAPRCIRCQRPGWFTLASLRDDASLLLLSGGVAALDR